MSYEIQKLHPLQQSPLPETKIRGDHSGFGLQGRKNFFRSDGQMINKASECD